MKRELRGLKESEFTRLSVIDRNILKANTFKQIIVSTSLTPTEMIMQDKTVSLDQKSKAFLDRFVISLNNPVWSIF